MIHGLQFWFKMVEIFMRQSQPVGIKVKGHSLETLNDILS